MSIKETGETKDRFFKFRYFPMHSLQIKKLQLEEEDTRIIFLWDFRSRYSSRLHKIS